MARRKKLENTSLEEQLEYVEQEMGACLVGIVLMHFALKRQEL